MFRGNSLKPGAHSKGRTLTVAELDVCVGIESDVRALRSRIDQTELSDSVAEIRYRGLEQAVNVRRQALDRTDQREIDADSASILVLCEPNLSQNGCSSRSTPSTFSVSRMP